VGLEWASARCCTPTTEPLGSVHAGTRDEKEVEENSPQLRRKSTLQAELPPGGTSRDPHQYTIHQPHGPPLHLSLPPQGPRTLIAATLAA
jgi:hypothetical protein